MILPYTIFDWITSLVFEQFVESVRSVFKQIDLLFGSGHARMKEIDILINFKKIVENRRRIFNELLFFRKKK